MRPIAAFFFALGPILSGLSGACSSTETEGWYVSSGKHVGEPISAERRLRLADLGAQAEAIGGEPVLIEATARDVCTHKGCWMQIEDGKVTALARWADGCDGAHAFSPETVGKRVLVQGTVHRTELSDEEVEHLLAESRQGRDPRSNTFEIRVSSLTVMRGRRSH